MSGYQRPYNNIAIGGSNSNRKLQLVVSYFRRDQSPELRNQSLSRPLVCTQDQTIEIYDSKLEAQTDISSSRMILVCQNDYTVVGLHSEMAWNFLNDISLCL